MKPILLILWLALLAVPGHLKAGLPDEDAAVRELYLAYRSGIVPPLTLLAPGTLWHCTYFQAEKGNFYRASTYMQFYTPRQDGLIRSVTRVTYPRRVTATTYFGFTAFGLLSATDDSNVYTSVRQTGPAQLVLEHFETPVGSAATRNHSLTAPAHGTAFAYSGCIAITQ